jgi:hypothetical protein
MRLRSLSTGRGWTTRFGTGESAETAVEGETRKAWDAVEADQDCGQAFGPALLGGCMAAVDAHPEQHRHWLAGKHAGERVQRAGGESQVPVRGLPLEEHREPCRHRDTAC